jgi:hypothetical protein
MDYWNIQYTLLNTVSIYIRDLQKFTLNALHFSNILMTTLWSIDLIALLFPLPVGPIFPVPGLITALSELKQK